MKIETTKKAIRNGSRTLLSIGYCEAQNLLYYKNPFAYSHGVDGWSCDYYHVGNVIVSTGYSPIGQHIHYDIVRDLEKQAEAIVNDYSLPYDVKVEKIDALLELLITSI